MTITDPLYHNDDRDRNRCVWVEQSQEAVDFCASIGYLISSQGGQPLVPDSLCEAFGRAILRYQHFLTQEMLLDSLTSAEIMREFIREWRLSR